MTRDEELCFQFLRFYAFFARTQSSKVLVVDKIYRAITIIAVYNLQFFIVIFLTYQKGCRIQIHWLTIDEIFKIHFFVNFYIL
jgi:hypothetical protein